jgi:hypothetical protein
MTFTNSLSDEATLVVQEATKEQIKYGWELFVTGAILGFAAGLFIGVVISA